MNDRKPVVRSAVLVMLGGCLALWLSGCSAATPDSEEPNLVGASADSPLMADIRQSVDATTALTSAHLAIRVNGQVDAMLGVNSADVDVRAKPLAAEGVCTYNDQEGVPFRIKDDTISVKLFDDWTNLGSVSDQPAARLIDPTNGVAKLLSGVTNLQSQGPEVIDGVPTARITGTLPPDTVKLIDPGARKSKPATLWIASDGSHRLVAVRVDLGSSQSVQVKLSKWNEPVNVE